MSFKAQNIALTGFLNLTLLPHRYCVSCHSDGAVALAARGPVCDRGGWLACSDSRSSGVRGAPQHRWPPVLRRMPRTAVRLWRRCQLLDDFTSFVDSGREQREISIANQAPRSSKERDSRAAGRARVASKTSELSRSVRFVGTRYAHREMAAGCRLLKAYTGDPMYASRSVTL